MKLQFAEEGLITSLLKHPDEDSEAALARYFDAELIQPDLIEDPLRRAQYSFVQECALQDVAVTPDMFAAEFDYEPRKVKERMKAHDRSALPVYAKKITDERFKKVAASAADELRRAAEKGDQQAAYEAIEQIGSIRKDDDRRIYTLTDHTAMFMQILEEDQKRKREGYQAVQFPLPKLNEMVPRIMEDDIILITARSKTGKSSFSTQTVYANARKGKRVLYFHFEDSKAKVGYRRTAQLQAFIRDRRLTIPYSRMISKELSPKELETMRYLSAQAVNEVGDNLVYAYASGWTCEKMIAVWRQLHKRNPFDLIVIDYLNKMELSSTKLRNFGQFNARGRDVEMIKQEAGRPNARVPVFLVQQENPDGSPRDSKDSYIKSQAWISLQRDEDHDDPDQFKLTGDVVVKRANDGMTGPIPARFIPKYMIWDQL